MCRCLMWKPLRLTQTESPHEGGSRIRLGPILCEPIHRRNRGRVRVVVGVRVGVVVGVRLKVNVRLRLR
jgi:hypothetical protein